MTKAQENSIGRVRRLVERDLLDGHEVKRWEIEDCTYFVSLLVETGLKGDEGTYAEIFARNTAHLFIGKRGGVTFPVWNAKTQHQVRRAFHWYSILEAVVAQR